MEQGKEIKSLISRTGERGSTMLLSRDTIYIAQEDDVENLPAISRFLKANKVNFVVELIHIFYAIISADVRSALNIPIKDSRWSYNDVKSKPGKGKEERNKVSGRISWKHDNGPLIYSNLQRQGTPN
eukprot:747963-Hanusia_phi.AAC.2